MEGLIPMYCKKQIKRKAMLLSICSILGVGTMVDDHAMAMKSLKKLLSSVPSQEKIMKLAKLKLDSVKLESVKTGIELSKHDEEKLNAYVNNIIDERGYIKISENYVVNPIIYCLKNYSGYCFERLRKILNWIDDYIPAAFTSRETVDNSTSATPLFFAVGMDIPNEEKLDLIKILAPKSDTTAMCKYQVPGEKTVYMNPIEFAHNYGKTEVNCFHEKYKTEYPLMAVTILHSGPTFNKDFTVAVLNGNIKKLDKEIANGTDINTPVRTFTGEEFTPLDFALMRRDATMFDYLIQRGGKLSEGKSATDFIDFDIKIEKRFPKKIVNSTIFQNESIAFNANHFEFLKKVLACRELDFKFKNEKHKTDFINSEVFKHIYLDKDLYELFKSRFGKAPKECLLGVCNDNSLGTIEQIKLVNMLIKDGVTDFSCSPYYYKNIAIKNKNLPLLKHLHSLNPTLPETAVNEAVEYSTSLEIIKFLVEDCKLPLDAVYNSRSLIHSFMNRFDRIYYKDNTIKEKGHLIDIAKYLIKKGMDVNGINSIGKTLLGQVACTYEKQYSELGVALHNVFVKAGAKTYLD